MLLARILLGYFRRSASGIAFRGNPVALARNLIAAVALAVTAPAAAAVITVTNASFEILPAGGLPSGCGAGCSFSSDAIPGWTNSAASSGQFQPGPAAGNFTYFNYIPDGLTVAYTNGSGISQTVGATAVAGTTYTLSVAVGFRKDFTDYSPVSLLVGAGSAAATGTPLQLTGDWSTYTATYTATAADAGGAITILLGPSGPQGDFDAVSLTADAAVPEPATWVLMIGGFGLAGAALRRRRAVAA